MKRLMTIIFATGLASAAQAKWEYDPNVPRITDGIWDFRFTENGNELTLTNCAAGSGDVDFSTLFADIGKKVVEFGVNTASGAVDRPGVFYASSAVKSIVAPDVVRVGLWSCGSCNNLTNVVLSSGLTTLGGWAFWNDSKICHFKPGSLPLLSSMGVGSLQNLGSAVAFDQLEQVDLVLPALTILSNNDSFRNSPIFRSLSAENLSSVSGNDNFRSCTGFVSACLPKLATVSSTGLFQDCAALGEVEINGTLTTLQTDMFNGCAALSNVVVRAPVTQLKAGSLKGLAPHARVTFYGAVPTVASDSLSAVGAEANDCRIVVQTVQGASSAFWQQAVAPQASTFEAYKAIKPDYPGADCFGLLYDGTAYSWVQEIRYQVKVVGDPENFAAVTPNYGEQFGYADGETVTFSAPADEVAVSDDARAVVSGWKLFTATATGPERQVSSGTGTTCSFTYRAGKQYKLVWIWIYTKFRITVNSASGGAVEGLSGFYASGATVDLAATPDATHAFGCWLGASAADCAVNPLKLKIDRARTITPFFGGKWQYDSGAQTISDGNWTLSVTEISGDLTIVSSGPASGSGVLALTSFPQDVPGHHVVALSDVNRKQSVFSSETQEGRCVITAFVAPEVTSVGSWVFASPGSQFTLVALSPDLKTLGDHAFWATGCVKRFAPSRMPKMTTFSTSALADIGKDGGADREFVELELPALTALGTSALQNNGLVVSLVATGVTSAAASICEDGRALTNVVLSATVTPLNQNAFKNIAGGALIHLNGSKAPRMYASCIVSREAANRARILIDRKHKDSGWDDLIVPLTDEDRARADYPGKSAVGKLADAYGDAWLVETKPRLGFQVSIR